MITDEVKAVYVGTRGGYLHGVPRRDITAADWARLTAEQQTAVKNSKLYEMSKPEKNTGKRKGE